MGLSDIWTATQTKLTATLTGLVPQEPVPEYLIGADRVMNEGSPPRIVFVPTTERIEGPHGQGGDGIRNPRPLRTRHSMVEFHIWGTDPTGLDNFGATEKLANHLVAALHEIGCGVYQIIGGDWTVGQASTTRTGLVYVLRVEFEIPFTRELDTYATVTTIPITPSMQPPA